MLGCYVGLLWWVLQIDRNDKRKGSAPNGTLGARYGPYGFFSLA